MTFMSAEQLEQLRVHTLQALWRELFPDFEAPYKSRMQKWLQLGGPDLCEYAIRRAWRKRIAPNRRGEPMTAGRLRRYAETVIEHEMAGDRERNFLREWGKAEGDGCSVNAEEAREGTQA